MPQRRAIGGRVASLHAAAIQRRRGLPVFVEALLARTIERAAVMVQASSVGRSVGAF